MEQNGIEKQITAEFKTTNKKQKWKKSRKRSVSNPGLSNQYISRPVFVFSVSDRR